MPATDDLSRVFAALADPTRRDILSRLGDEPITVGALAAHYPVSRPAISQHLSVLEKAGLVSRTVNAQWREVRVSETGLDEVGQWIATQRAEWSERFGFLDQHLRAKRAARNGEQQ
ncbi:ArsR/SmtB family transcription factor [Pseudolysinimonas sp.]|jgi:DNA-binding transcriptional ArsR family regulator|uniref:ArsR/SmtB family transcription factor n=1 Tax=Pseudolysinimonas sp. TaxID=2680009 RepID=UPI003783033D